MDESTCKIVIDMLLNRLQSVFDDYMEMWEQNISYKNKLYISKLIIGFQFIFIVLLVYLLLMR